MCMIESSDPADVYRTENPRARKPWKCDDCSRAIEPGERYLRVTLLAEGMWSTFELCAHCEAAGEWLQQVCGGFLVGGISEDLSDHWSEHSYPVRTASLGRLVHGIRRGWKRKDGALMPVEQVKRWALSGARLAANA